MAGGREQRMAVGFARVEEMCFVLPNQVVVVAVDQMVLPVKPLQHGFDVCGLFGKADIAEVVHSVLRGNDAVPAVDQVFVQLVGVIAFCSLRPPCYPELFDSSFQTASPSVLFI